MTVFTLDPLDDDRWCELVDRHPWASVFHTRGWVSALQQTYGYRPVVYTTSRPEGPLQNGILLCHVRSWLTGRRLVSVPFADHCEPLVTLPDERAALVAGLSAAAGDWKYVELRPRGAVASDDPGFQPTKSFRYHVVDLRPSLEETYEAFHPSTIQRKIGRAGREGVACEQGRSEALLQAFYCLTVQTRRRHGIPPQPIQWFRNLMVCFGNRLTIRLAVKDGRPIGGILTLQHRKTLFYKYGCSDARFHHLGTMPLLFWTAMQTAKAAGVEKFDLGRSDLDNPGLATFKERLGAVGSTLTYFRASRHRGRGPGGRMHVPPSVVARIPERLLIAAGKLLYRHMG